MKIVSFISHGVAILSQIHFCNGISLDRLAAKSIPSEELVLANPTSSGRYVNTNTTIEQDNLRLVTSINVTTDALPLSKRAVGPGVEACWSASDTTASLIAKFRADCEPLITAYTDNPLGRIDLGYEGA